MSNSIWHIFWDPSSGLHSEPWAGPDANNGTPAAEEAPAVLATDHQQHVFYRAAGGQVEHVLWDDSSGKHAEVWAPAEQDYHAPIAYGPSLQKSSSGSHTWDYNTDGVAHYGMLVDFLEAVRGAPNGNDLVDNNLMFGAQYFYETWQKAEQQSAKVK